MTKIPKLIQIMLLSDSYESVQFDFKIHINILFFWYIFLTRYVFWVQVDKSLCDMLCYANNAKLRRVCLCTQLRDVSSSPIKYKLCSLGGTWGQPYYAGSPGSLLNTRNRQVSSTHVAYWIEARSS